MRKSIGVRLPAREPGRIQSAGQQHSFPSLVVLTSAEGMHNLLQLVDAPMPPQALCQTAMAFDQRKNA